MKVEKILAMESKFESLPEELQNDVLGYVQRVMDEQDRAENEMMAKAMEIFAKLEIDEKTRALRDLQLQLDTQESQGRIRAIQKAEEEKEGGELAEKLEKLSDFRAMVVEYYIHTIEELKGH